MGGKRDLTLILQGKTKVNLAFFQVILFEKVLYVYNIYFKNMYSCKSFSNLFWPHEGSQNCYFKVQTKNYIGESLAFLRCHSV
jgi:hypothetical protein